MNEKEIEEAIETLKKTFNVKCGFRNYAYYSEMISDLYRKLQAYKDKEDKLREYMNGKSFEQAFENDNNMKSVERHILQILNEGEKE